VKDRVIKNILMWVRRQYNEGKEEETKKYEEKFGRIASVFAKVVGELQLSSAEIVREKSFFSMLKAIQEIEPRLISYVLKQRFEQFEGNYLQEDSILLN
jgi:hypothetical protein